MESKLCFTGIAFPESLRWHNGDLWFSDILAGSVYRGNVDTGKLEEVLHIEPQVSGLGWLVTGELVVVNCHSRQVIRADASGKESLFADLSGEWSYPANDMLVDGDSTVWVGTYGFDPDKEPPAPATLARIMNGVVDYPVSGLVFANGIARIDDSRIIVAETFADRLSVIQTKGQVEILKQIQLPQGSTPDGVVADNDGFVWVASAYGEAILRVNIASGEFERAIEIPGRGVYDCTFGGRNLDKLYVAVSDIDETNILRDLPGQILSFDLAVDYPGVRGIGNK